MAKTEYSLDAVNQRLKAAKTKVSIKQRGETLSMRATLPPKPGSDRPNPHRQVIALHLPASENGFKRAEQEARLLGARLSAKEFDWSFYLDGGSDRDLAAKLVERFKQQYMSTHTLTEATWNNHWWKIYKRLPQDKPLDVATLITLVHQTERNSRNRLHTCKKLQKLADFAGLKVDLLQFQGNYGGSKVEDRDLPTDETIIQCRAKIKNSAWRWIYGAMAAYGLRDHEAFFCKFTPDGLYVTQGKTGPRLVFAALYPEWVEQWELAKVELPPVRLDKGYEYLSERTSKAFRRYGIPFVPYDLRHAYAVRASVEFNYPTPTAAALMGHSPETHLRTYQRHINQQQHLETSKRILGSSDRPKPPDV
ncbi:MAG: site-specific recombinase [Leptolyngbyaceae cyanobacterium SM1_4_3]|nr:site-specific recombinase [Leptolyngbyaceae cyanobacterium SM1_4_3]NJN90027.1 site-specific recombinase [Leptolyngbyaceae cyanobacterium SL_5_14]